MSISVSRASIFAALLSVLACACVRADDPPVSEGQKLLAIKSDAVIVARVGMLSPALKDNPAFAALWVERGMKGRFTSGRDIVWVSRKEFPKAEVGAALWLVFLTRAGDGSYHILNNEAGEGLSEVKSPKSLEVTRVAKFLGHYAPPQDAEPLGAGDLVELMKTAARGSQERRRESMLRLVRGGDAVMPALETALSSDDHQDVSLAKTLLPILRGGPAVNGLRLSLESGVIELKPDQQRIVSVNFSNVSDQPMRIVSGASSWGDNVVSSSAWEVRPVLVGENGRTSAGEPLATVLPFGFGQPKPGDSAPQPLVRVAPAFGQVAIAVTLRLEKIQIDGKDVLRLFFSQGHVDLSPAATRYSLGVKFECPGPRADQKGLIDAQYWAGGRLASNEIILEIR